MKSVPGPADWFWVGGRVCALVSVGGAARRVGRPSGNLLSVLENNTGLKKKLARQWCGHFAQPSICLYKIYIFSYTNVCNLR